MDAAPDEKMKGTRPPLKAIEAFEEISESFESQGCAFEAVAASYIYSSAERSPGRHFKFLGSAHALRVRHFFCPLVPLKGFLLI